MSNNPILTQEWKDLEAHKAAIESARIESFFSDDAERFETLSTSLQGMLYDISKTHVTSETIDLLCAFARAQGLDAARTALLKGDIVNKTENRAALHTAQRDGSVDLEQLTIVSEQIRSGEWRSASGKQIESIVHIGLGGSGLGPELLHQAFLERKAPHLNFHFVTNIDGTDMTRALNACDPETTLFIVVSKSFTTQETRVNSDTARAWLAQHYQDAGFVDKHFVAITANPEKAKQYGIASDNIFAFDEGVGGRFSLWSAVGLTTCIAFGVDNFKELLRGANAMDQHFENAEFDQNIPVLMGLIDTWHRNFWDYESKAVLPYAQELKALPAYLQQLEMESNGKNIDLDGNDIEYQTAPVIFGDVGTTSQHSFFQLLHQGTNIIPCDFIGVKTPNHELDDHHDKLLNNLLAQSQALLQGKETSEAHRKFTGNRPNTTILLDKMDAYHLGMLIALYEHKVFVQSILWNINAFDQFGVELGKEMAHKMEDGDMSGADPSTRALFSIAKGP